MITLNAPFYGVGLYWKAIRNGKTWNKLVVLTKLAINSIKHM